MLPDNFDDDVEEGMIPLLLMTNEPTEQKLKTLELLYQSLSFGQLAYLDGKDPDTGEIVPLLVGLQPEENGKVSIYPIAKLFTKEDNLVNYQIPDGSGNYTSVDAGEPIDLGIDYSAVIASDGDGSDSGEASSGKTEGHGKETLH